MSYSFKSVSDALDSLCYSFDKLINSGFYADVDKASNISLTPKHVYINWKKDTTYTTVVWEDGTSTVVKKAEGDMPDHEKALMYAILKKAAGNNTSAVRRYLKSFDDNTTNIISFRKEKEKKKKTKGGYQE